MFHHQKIRSDIRTNSRNRQKQALQAFSSRRKNPGWHVDQILRRHQWEFIGNGHQQNHRFHLRHRHESARKLQEIQNHRGLEHGVQNNFSLVHQKDPLESLLHGGNRAYRKNLNDWLYASLSSHILQSQQKSIFLYSLILQYNYLLRERFPWRLLAFFYCYFSG